MKRPFYTNDVTDFGIKMKESAIVTIFCAFSNILYLQLRTKRKTLQSYNMLRRRHRLILPAKTIVIDPIEYPQSDIDQESYSEEINIPVINPRQINKASLLSSVKLKNRIEPYILGMKQEPIILDEQQVQSYATPHQQNSKEMDYQHSSIVFTMNKGNQPSLKKQLKKLTHVPNKVKLQKKDETSIECSICLNDLKGVQERVIGRLNCGHCFCFACIMESSKFATKCPYCRAPYLQIRKGNRIVKVPEVVPTEELDNPMDEPCYICGRNDDFQRLLECEYCEYAYCHTYCDARLRSDRPPTESWYCLSCQQLLRNQLSGTSEIHYDQIYEEQS